MLIVSAVLLYIFSKTSGQKISRVEGGVMLAIFAVYYTLVFVI